MLKKLSIFTLFAVFFTSSAVAKEQDKKSLSSELLRSFTLTPGYMERTFNSNDMMKYGPLSLMQLSTKGFDAISSISSSSEWRYVGMLYLIPHFILSTMNNTVYHEFGHARAMAAAGVSYNYSAALETSLPTDYAYGIYLHKLFNPQALLDGASTSPKSSLHLRQIPQTFLDRVINNSLINNVTHRLNSWWQNPKIVDKNNLSPAENKILTLMEIEHNYSDLPKTTPSLDYISSVEINDIIKKIMSSQPLSYKEQNVLCLLEDNFYLYDIINGLNNQMRYSQEIANLIFEQNGHFLYLLDYLDAKISAFGYVLVYQDQLKKNNVSNGNDIANTLRLYKNRAFDIEDTDIQIGSMASLLLSSTTWAFAYSAFTQLPNGNFIVYAPVWHGWRLPDLNFYLTTQGLSYEIVTGYQINPNWYAGLSAEMVYKGNTTYEFGPSLGYTFNTTFGKISLDGQLIFGKNMEMGGNVGAKWTSGDKAWAVGLKYIYHNALTLVGERNIPFLSSGFMSGGEPSVINHEINLTLSYNY